MRTYVAFLLAAQAAALSAALPAVAQGAPVLAAGQTTGQCTNLANPPMARNWRISSQPALPTRLQFNAFVERGENFSSVAGTSTTDVWAVGGGNPFGPEGPGGNALTYHFDGTQWCRVSDRDLEGINEVSGLGGVVALAPDNAWAVGFQLIVGPASVIQHWEGTRWKTVPSPNPGDPNTAAGSLSSISAVAPNDIWAVGYDEDKSGVPSALLAHYDGQAWTAVTPPKLPGNNTFAILFRVFARAHDDVWAVGLKNHIGGFSTTLIEHFDGNVWTVVPSVNGGDSVNILFGVTATAANDAWAVGYSQVLSHKMIQSPLAEHWDGKRWSSVPTAPTRQPNTVLQGVTARSASDVWAVGYSNGGIDSPNSEYFTPLVEHWTGTGWVVVPAAKSNVPGSTTPIQGITIGNALTDIALFPAGSGETLIAAGQYSTPVTNPQGTTYGKRHPYTITMAP